MSDQVQGTLARIRRYPVKGMKGEDLKRAKIELWGLSGDRTFAFIDDRMAKHRFPWMTGRQVHEFLLYEPDFASIGEGEITAPFQVSSPRDNVKFSISDPEFEHYLESKSGLGMTFKHDPKGCFDSKPISLIGKQTIEKLSKESGIENLDQARFRANLYVEWINGEPAFFEDSLVGKTLLLGEKNNVAIRVVVKDSRCVIPTLDPKTAIPSPVVLETIKRLHRGYIGVYGEVEHAGEVKVGDPVFVASSEKQPGLDS